jgi:hypothetical protein
MEHKYIIYRKHKKQRGLVFVWTVLSMIVFLGMLAMSIDVGSWYYDKAEMQNVADACALAGAWDLANGGASKSAADTEAQKYMFYNVPAGLDKNTYSFSSTYPVGVDASKYQVRIGRPAHRYFSQWFNGSAMTIYAHATGEFKTGGKFPHSGKNYGIGNGPYSYSQFGKYAQHSFGDKYSTLYNNDGTVNADYIPGGQAYDITYPSTYASTNGTSLLQVEIYDPECWNPGGDQVDEIRSPNSNDKTFGTSKSYNQTPTVYTLQYTSDGANWTPVHDTNGNLSTATFRDESATNMQWVTPSGFTIDTNTYPLSAPGEQLRVVVQTPDGSSENGYDLRAGPPHTTVSKDSNGNNYQTASYTYADPVTGNSVTTQHSNYALSAINETAWHSTYSGFDINGNPISSVNGSMISADTRLPLNINQTGSIDVLLGGVPASAAGTNISITRFDTDVGFSSLYYWCDAYGQGVKFPQDANGNQITLTTTGDDGEHTDTITLPSTYPGGNWHAQYSAGASDTSSWSLYYGGPSTTGTAELVGSAGLSY